MAAPPPPFSPPSAPPAPPIVPGGGAAWERYCSASEVRPEIQSDLYNVLQNTHVVLLLDDSGSMMTAVRPPGSNPMTPATTSRWSELMGDTQALVQLVTAVNPRGLDITFMNRPGARGITDVAQIAPLFVQGPTGGTPMIGLLRRTFAEYGSMPGRVLIILVTDGEPSDGEYEDLKQTLFRMPPNCFISFVECNDNEEEMDYLTSWDTLIPRFHNQEDYGEELALVRRLNGPSAKFTRANYIQMIVLSPIFPKYAIDVRSRDPKRNPFGTAGGGGYAPQPPPLFGVAPGASGYGQASYSQPAPQSNFGQALPLGYYPAPAAVGGPVYATAAPVYGVPPYTQQQYAQQGSDPSCCETM